MSPDVRQVRLEAAQATGRLPSIVAATFDRAGTTWQGRAGAVPAGPAGPADPMGAQYRIGSITKTMTAVLVLQCRDEGLLSLEDPLGTVIPESGYRDRPLRDLLAHTSGMQSEPVGPWWERAGRGSFEELLAANDGMHAVAAAGEYYHYSNLAYALLGEAVARVRRDSWWRLVQQRLLTPLAMTRTSYHPGPAAQRGYSVQHFTGILQVEPDTDTGSMAPAGQLWSTVGDLTRWGRFLADGHDSVLSASTLAAMSLPHTPEYGLGLRLSVIAGSPWVGHTGSMPGHLAALFVNRDSGRGVALLTNATTGCAPEALARDLAEGTACEPPPRPWSPTDSVPEAARELTGIWFWGNTAFDVRWHNHGLEFHELAGRGLSDRFEAAADGFVGVDGYHRGERLRVVRRPADADAAGEPGDIAHLEAATFVYTRVPYDPQAPIPGR